MSYVMTTQDYKKIRNSIFATVAASLILSIGSVLTNYYNTNFQVKENKGRIINLETTMNKKVDKEDLNYKMNELNKDINELKEAQAETNRLLWKLNDKIK